MNRSAFRPRADLVFFAAILVVMLTLNGCSYPPNEVIDVMDAEFQSVDNYSQYDVESKRLSRDQPL